MKREKMVEEMQETRYVSEGLDKAIGELLGVSEEVPETEEVAYYADEDEFAIIAIASGREIVVKPWVVMDKVEILLLHQALV